MQVSTTTTALVTGAIATAIGVGGGAVITGLERPDHEVAGGAMMLLAVGLPIAGSSVIGARAAIIGSTAAVAGGIAGALVGASKDSLSDERLWAPGPISRPVLDALQRA